MKTALEAIINTLGTILVWGHKYLNIKDSIRSTAWNYNTAPIFYILLWEVFNLQGQAIPNKYSFRAGHGHIGQNTWS